MIEANGAKHCKVLKVIKRTWAATIWITCCVASSTLKDDVE